jgi:MFS family permease
MTVNVTDATSAVPLPVVDPQRRVKTVATDQRSEWAANWPLLLSAMLGVSVPVAMSALLGQFMAPLEHEFHWTRAESSIGYSVSLLLGFVSGPFIGRLADKTNARMLVLPGIVLTGLAMAAFSLATPSIAVWIGLWCTVSAVGALVGPTVWLSVISATFEKNRSQAISIAISGMSIATMLAPISGRLLIDAYGWRMAWVMLALVWTGPALVMALLFFHDRRPMARSRIDPRNIAAPKPALRRAMMSGTFIRLALAVTVVNIAGSSFLFHLYPSLLDKGMNATTAATVIGVVGAAAIVGKLSLGSFFDRVGQVPVTLSIMTLYALASVILAQNSASVLLAIAGCVVLGLATGGFLVTVACITARLFDGAIFGVLYGSLTSLSVLAAAIGPLMVSRFHDVTGNYAPVFWSGIGIACVAALLLTRLVPVRGDDPASA